MKQKLKRNKGITLVALIITIVILLILAVVAISAVKGDGIISHAKNAKTDYTKAQSNEKSTLQGYLDKLEESQLASGKIKDNLNKVLSTGGNITLEDDFGNKIKVPAGFKIITKTDTENTDLNYTADDIDVTKGIVVEDEESNQFVWIPVGKIYTDAEKTEANAKTITLGRYGAFRKINNAYIAAQNASDYGAQVKISNSYTEDTTANTNHNSIYKNSIAKNIGDFCAKALASGGYYIGRYEARTGTERNSGTDVLTSVTLKANDYVYNYVIQWEASRMCQSMYTSNLFTSDLVNSYAWDTAIIFFQEFGGEPTYSSKKSVNSSLANTGTSGTNYNGTKDVICNVYDMASNCLEWSTETTNRSDDMGFSTVRGGANYNHSYEYTSARNCYGTANDFVYISFRPVLYM